MSEPILSIFCLSAHWSGFAIGKIAGIFGIGNQAKKTVAIGAHNQSQGLQHNIESHLFDQESDMDFIESLLANRLNAAGIDVDELEFLEDEVKEMEEFFS